MSALDKLVAILQLFPVIMGSVVAIENSGLFPPKSGKDKADLLVKTVNAAVTTIPEIGSTLSPTDIALATAAIAAGTVNALNTSGIFRKSTSPPVV